jgi:hypothetical protein
VFADRDMVELGVATLYQAVYSGRQDCLQHKIIDIFLYIAPKEFNSTKIELSLSSRALRQVVRLPGLYRCLHLNLLPSGNASDP